jgi:putative ABC transport system permease protein
VRFLGNLRYAWRLLWKNPGLTGIILLTVALGVGANTAIFTVDYATLLATLPYPHSDQLVTVWTANKSGSRYPSAENFIDWRRQSQAFQDLSAISGGTFEIGATETPESVWGMRATANYYRTLGSSFFLGRNFLQDEDQAGKDHVVIITHKLWNHLGADPRLVGHMLRVDGEPYTVVGVLQPGIADRDIFQMTVPLVFTFEALHHSAIPLVVVGRLKPGVTIMRAQDQIAAVTQLAQSDAKDIHVKSAIVEPLKDYVMALSREMRRTLWLLLGAVGFVLLIACVNVANLLLSRGAARRKEIAVRCALGATRTTIFMQTLMESLVLAMAGGILGAGVGYSMLCALLAAMPPLTLPWGADTHLNPYVFLFTLAATMLAGLLFGCAPAWYTSRIDPGEGLKSGGAAGLGVGRHGLQRMLVVGELALALSLVAGAGLAIHSFINLMQVDMGVKTDHVLTFYLSDPPTRPKEPEKIIAYYKQMLSSLQLLPGVSSVSAQTGTPLFRMYSPTPFAIVGEPAHKDPSTVPKVDLGKITPDYFKTFGIRIVKGRSFDDHDAASGVKVAMVNEDFVRTFLKGSDPLRQLISIWQSNNEMPSANPTEWQVVGVYHDVLSGSMREQHPEIQIPFWQSPSPGPAIAVRTGGDPDSMAKSIAAAVYAIGPKVFVVRPRTRTDTHPSVKLRPLLNDSLYQFWGGGASTCGAGSLWCDVLFR